VLFSKAPKLFEKAKSIANSSERDQSLEALAKSLVFVDNALALEAAQAISHSYRRFLTLSEIANKAVNSDIDLAIKASQALLSDEYRYKIRYKMLADIALQLIATEPKKAENLLFETFNQAMTISDAKERACALTFIAKATLSLSSDLPLKFLQTAFLTLQDIAEIEKREKRLETFTQQIAPSQNEVALQAAEILFKSAPESYCLILASLAAAQAQGSPDRAQSLVQKILKAAETIPEPSRRCAALSSAAGATARASLDLAEPFFQSHFQTTALVSDMGARAKRLALSAKNWKRVAPEKSLEAAKASLNAAESIEDKAQCALLYAEIARLLFDSHPPQSQEIFKKFLDASIDAATPFMAQIIGAASLYPELTSEHAREACDKATLLQDSERAVLFAKIAALLSKIDPPFANKVAEKALQTGEVKDPEERFSLWIQVASPLLMSDIECAKLAIERAFLAAQAIEDSQTSALALMELATDPLLDEDKAQEAAEEAYQKSLSHPLPKDRAQLLTQLANHLPPEDTLSLKCIDAAFEAAQSVEEVKGRFLAVSQFVNDIVKNFASSASLFAFKALKNFFELETEEERSEIFAELVREGLIIKAYAFVAKNETSHPQDEDLQMALKKSEIVYKDCLGVADDLARAYTLAQLAKTLFHHDSSDTLAPQAAKKALEAAQAVKGDGHQLYTLVKIVCRLTECDPLLARAGADRALELAKTLNKDSGAIASLDEKQRKWVIALKKAIKDFADPYPDLAEEITKLL
jgi:hypothetical protein